MTTEHVAGRSPLAGTWDTHVHAAPDSVPRRQDYFAVARAAQAMGMAGIVFKDVGQPTSDRAYAAMTRVTGIRAIGGVVLDLPVGGLNPHAARAVLERGGRVVWMPVVHSRQSVERYRQGAVRLSIPPAIDPQEALSVHDRSGRLTREVKEIVSIIASFDAVLATGHLSPRESIDLLDYASSHGVTRMLVNHPAAPVVAASVEEQIMLAGTGAFLEHCYAQCTPVLDNLPLGVISKAIMAVGPEHCVLATDLGQVRNPPPVAGLARFRSALGEEGWSDDDLDLMMVANPGTLFA